MKIKLYILLPESENRSRFYSFMDSKNLTPDERLDNAAVIVFKYSVEGYTETLIRRTKNNIARAIESRPWSPQAKFKIALYEKSGPENVIYQFNL